MPTDKKKTTKKREPQYFRARYLNEWGRCGWQIEPLGSVGAKMFLHDNDEDWILLREVFPRKRIK